MEHNKTGIQTLKAKIQMEIQRRFPLSGKPIILFHCHISIFRIQG